MRYIYYVYTMWVYGYVYSRKNEKSEASAEKIETQEAEAKKILAPGQPCS